MIHSSCLTSYRQYSFACLNSLSNLLRDSKLMGYSSIMMSFHGSRNARLVTPLLESLKYLSNAGCASEGGLDRVRFEPLCSFEAILHPSNWDSELFKYASVFHEGGAYSPVLAEVVEHYGALCHMLGSSRSFSFSDLKRILMSHGISRDDSILLVDSIKRWLLCVLRRSKPKEYVSELILENCEIDLEVLLSSLYCLLSSSALLIDAYENEYRIHSLNDVINYLWGSSIEHWTSHGGPVFCLLKVIVCLFTIKSSLVSTEGVSQGPVRRFNFTALQNTFVCFKVACVGCEDCASNELDKLTICGKTIIVGCSSNKAFPTEISNILSMNTEPKDGLSALMSRACSIDLPDGISWLYSDSVQHIMGIYARLVNSFENKAPRLTSLSLMAVPNDVCVPLVYLCNLMESRLGIGPGISGEGNTCSLVRMKEVESCALSYYSLFFNTHLQRVKMRNWSKWLAHVVESANPRNLEKNDIYLLIKFVAELCRFPSQSARMRESARLVMCRVEQCYSEPITEESLEELSELLVSLFCCIVFLEECDMCSLKSWLFRSMCLGADMVSKKRAKLEPSALLRYGSLYRDDTLLMPYDMSDN